MKLAKTAAMSLIAVCTGSVAAGDRKETLVNRNTTLNLIEALVKKGVLDKDSADAMIREAEEKAEGQADAELAREEAAEPASGVSPKGPKKGETIHVPYVPQSVRKELRKEVREELKDEVVKEVKAQAKAEKWGIPAALPEWVSAIKLNGDMRLRVVDDFYGSENVTPPNSPYLDYLAINRERSLREAQTLNEAFLNTNVDRLRLRERFRIGFDAQITDSLKAGFRFATSNIQNPVSNNQTLGNTGQSWQFAIDRGFLEYDFVDAKGNDWFSLYGGRIINPFFSTDVVYDPDLSFEGFATTLRYRFNQDDPRVSAYHAPRPTARPGINLGPQTPNTVFATFGVFPIQEVNFSQSDKWLFGGQIGADWLIHGESRLKLGVAYYDYENIRARRNPTVTNGAEAGVYDWTAPQFIQKGNSMVPITDTANHPTTCGSVNQPDICLFGLASNFRIFNVTAAYDLAEFAPIHALLTLDYAKNLGYDRSRILREFGSSYALPGKTNAYQVRLDVGNPEALHFNDWNISLAYRYVERDAVLDAFTDSVFHLGGTDAKGWVVGVNYGILRNTWLNFRWFSTEAIDGPPLTIDTAVLDLNARF